MAEKLTPEKIEEIGKHYENIQSGKSVTKAVQI